MSKIKDNLRRYPRRAGTGVARQNVRVSLRDGELLTVSMTSEILKQLGTTTGKDVHFNFSERQFVIEPAIDGGFRIRKQVKGYPFIYVPVGPDKPLECKFTVGASTIIEHEIDNGRLVLPLPECLKITINEPPNQKKRFSNETKSARLRPGPTGTEEVTPEDEVLVDGRRQGDGKPG